MRIVECVVDITTRKVDKPFSYLAPSDLHIEVGQTLLVPFGTRKLVGYALRVRKALPTDPIDKIKPVAGILSESAFDEVAAELVEWIAQEYAATLSDAIKLFLAPGQSITLTKDVSGNYVLKDKSVHEKDERWARLTDTADVSLVSKRAPKQKLLIEALSAAPQRVRELSILLPNSSSSLKRLEELGIVEIYSERALRSGSEETSLSSAKAARPERYSGEQLQALRAIEHARRAQAGDVVVVDGVTGSGKTEVYLAAIEETLREGKDAIVLVPEISLTAQTVGRFRSRFGADVAILHSKLSQGERYDQWDMLRQGKVHVVVGARSALFAPLKHVGLIIIDEEHESSYKQDSQPRYHAREVAAHLAKLRRAALVLGSATPSLEALARCMEGRFRGVSWTRTQMLTRAGGAKLPKIELVNLAEFAATGKFEVFSQPLKKALLDTYESGRKSVLLLNRRGFANFLMCQDCGCVPECPYCSEALTYHERGHLLMCHSCGRSWPIRAYPDPTAQCPNCGSRYMGAFGIGTQRVEDELLALLGKDATVVRMDADTTRAQGGHTRLLETFDKAKGAVLLGTQMIAKGLDFPEVTLVGVINADTMLKLPDFRAAERTYDLLEQVAGRAGRGAESGRVLIQSYWTGHAAIQAVARHRRDDFVSAELAVRKEAMYPPYGRVSNIIVWGTNETEVVRASEQLAKSIASTCPKSWDILGPSDCLKARINKQFRRHVVIKSELGANPGPLLKQSVLACKIANGIKVAIDVDAYDLM